MLPYNVSFCSLINMSGVAANGATTRELTDVTFLVVALYMLMMNPPPIPMFCKPSTPSHNITAMAASTAFPPLDITSLKKYIKSLINAIKSVDKKIVHPPSHLFFGSETCLRFTDMIINFNIVKFILAETIYITGYLILIFIPKPYTNIVLTYI